MQLISAMRFLVAAVLIAGCESPRERFDRLDEEVDIVCWEYACNPRNQGSGPPSVPIDRAVSCMNDALASGARAVASWSDYDFQYEVRTNHVVFTIDHEVKAFFLYSAPGEEHTDEAPACTSPFRISDQPS